MFGMGLGEIVLIAVVALLVLGPDRLPDAAKAIGKGIRDLRATTKDLQSTIEQDTHLGDAVRELRGALRGDPESLYKQATGEDFHAKDGANNGKTAKEAEPKGGEVSSDDQGKRSNEVEDEVEDNAEGEWEGSRWANDNKDATKAGSKTDATLGALLDQAYDNRSDNWGKSAVNPHDSEQVAEQEQGPVLKVAEGAIARGNGKSVHQGDAGGNTSDG